MVDADLDEGFADAAAEDVRAREPDRCVWGGEVAAGGPVGEFPGDGRGHVVEALEVEERVAG